MKHQPPVNADGVEGRSDRIALMEESATIDKRGVAGRRVRVRTVTDTVEQTARLDLAQQDVDVERVMIDRIIDHAPEIKTEGDVTIIPIVEEVMVVETRLVLKEELRIRRNTRTKRVSTPIRLRRQRAVIDSVDPTGKVRVEQEVKDKS